MLSASIKSSLIRGIRATFHFYSPLPLSLYKRHSPLSPFLCSVYIYHLNRADNSHFLQRISLQWYLRTNYLSLFSVLRHFPSDSLSPLTSLFTNWREKEKLSDDRTQRKRMKKRSAEWRENEERWEWREGEGGVIWLSSQETLPMRVEERLNNTTLWPTRNHT